MMSNLYWLSDAQMERLKPFFPKSPGKPRVDDRRVLSGIIFINRNGLRWRDAPKEYGPAKTVYNRWKRWSDNGVFARIMVGLAAEHAEHKTIMIDATYDAYAGAFAIIHNNLTAALEAANISGESGTLNRQAKSAARSAFESAKQRFFGHLLTSMKTPTLIASIDADLAAGHAAVIQIVSTGEALMERRLSEIPTEEWNDIRVDITPREYVLSGVPDNT